MKQLTIIFFALLFSLQSVAQPRVSPDVRAERETQWMKDSANVTPEQSTKFNKISLAYHQKMDKASEMKSARAKKKERESLMRKKDSQMKALLSKEQYKKYYAEEKRLRKIEKSQENMAGPQPL
jgi:hypothetical protein